MKYLNKFNSFDKLNERWFPQDTYIHKYVYDSPDTFPKLGVRYIFEYFGNTLTEIVVSKDRKIEETVKLVELIINNPDKIKDNFKINAFKVVLNDILSISIQLIEDKDEQFIKDNLSKYGDFTKSKFNKTDCLILKLNDPINIKLGIYHNYLDKRDWVTKLGRD